MAETRPNIEELEANYHKSLTLWLRELTRQIEELSAEQEGVRSTLKAIESRRSDLRERYGATRTTSEKLRGKEAVLRVLEESGEWMTVAEIVEELQLRGWMDPGAKAPHEAVRVSLRRMEGDSAPIERNRMGRSLRFRFKLSEAPEMGTSDDLLSEGSPDGPAS